jgi:hypothetical protein
MSHALTRTSPKGTPFIGTCIKCGAKDIPLSRTHEHCVNPANLDFSDAMDVVLGNSDGKTKQ